TGVSTRPSHGRPRCIDAPLPPGVLLTSRRAVNPPIPCVLGLPRPLPLPRVLPTLSIDGGAGGSARAVGAGAGGGAGDAVGDAVGDTGGAPVEDTCGGGM